RSGSVDSFPPYESPSRQTPESPANNCKIWTWSEVAEELLNYSRKYGPIKVPEEKLEKTKGVRHIVSPSDKPEKGKQNSPRQYWWSLGLKKQIPKDVMDGLPLDKLIKIVLNWHCPKFITSNSPTVQPSAPPPPQAVATFGSGAETASEAGKLETPSLMGEQMDGAGGELFSGMPLSLDSPLQKKTIKNSVEFPHKDSLPHFSVSAKDTCPVFRSSWSSADPTSAKRLQRLSVLILAVSELLNEVTLFVMLLQWR
ncbi:hypothetical protein IHE44_0004774, partial [Lamprotornis superbus]